MVPATVAKPYLIVVSSSLPYCTALDVGYLLLSINDDTVQVSREVDDEPRPRWTMRLQDCDLHRGWPTAGLRTLRT